jgi:hypothetical protein
MARRRVEQRHAVNYPCAVIKIFERGVARNRKGFAGVGASGLGRNCEYFFRMGVPQKAKNFEGVEGFSIGMYGRFFPLHPVLISSGGIDHPLKQILIVWSVELQGRTGRHARASALLTDFAYHFPPRAVAMPRALSASAI